MRYYFIIIYLGVLVVFGRRVDGRRRGEDVVVRHVAPSGRVVELTAALQVSLGEVLDVARVAEELADVVVDLVRALDVPQEIDEGGDCKRVSGVRQHQNFFIIIFFFLRDFN